jgi:hypothetical protein
MLHDLLLALSGTPGDLFPLDAAPVKQPLWHPSEQQHVESLVASLGAPCRRLKTWSCPSLDDGIYTRAVKSAMTEMLRDYDAVLCVLERRFIFAHSDAAWMGPETPLALVRCQLQSYTVLFAHWMPLVDVKTEGLAWLDRVRALTQTGIPHLRAASDW